MYGVVKTKLFDRSIRKLQESGLFKAAVRKDLETVISLLAAGKPLPSSYADHRLKGDLQEHRECHIRGDLLLLYRRHDDKSVLVLADIGTHSYFFG